jgi:very-short-patch-repair endonuclease
LNPAEARLWAAINAGQLGVPFRRQVVVAGRYVADFFASGVRLVVEVDGGYHARRVRADAGRDEKLRRAGLTVLRLPAALVLANLPEAVRRVREALTR